nr:hypothetical protein Iba_scaffold36183CG0010 [Ipomoea batatas]GMD33211.1 hypothetical protein Iba_chr09cCG0520 [Ipomoea batatas]GMD38077.1 hypothetical protein Iba_chr09fCG0480 [Ipomoea batatas]
MHTALVPCCENDIIFVVMSCKKAMVMICGVKPIPAVLDIHPPIKINCCFRPLPGGLPRPLF